MQPIYSVTRRWNGDVQNTLGDDLRQIELFMGEMYDLDGSVDMEVMGDLMRRRDLEDMNSNQIFEILSTFKGIHNDDVMYSTMFVNVRIVI